MRSFLCSPKEGSGGVRMSERCRAGGGARGREGDG